MTETVNVSVTLTANANGLVGALTVSREELDRLRQTGSEASKALDDLTDANQSATRAGETQAKGAQRQGAVMRALRTEVSVLKSAFASLGVGFIVREFVQAASAVERTTSAMRAAVGGNVQAGREMQFVREEARRLGLNLLDASQNYVKLAAAARGTALQGAATREIFTSVSEASRVLGLTAEQTGGALTAVEQIISKGKVSAEELRGQLGERLPGAFQIAARAMGVTTQQLDGMLQKGELLAEDFLPRFAAELRKTFAGELPNAVQTADANFKRFENSIFDLKVAFGEELLPVVSGFASTLAETVIPAIAWAAREVGILSRNANAMGEGALIMRRDELRESRAGRQQRIDRLSVSPGNARLIEALEGQQREELGELVTINHRLAEMEARNERIVKLGADRVAQEEANAQAVGKTTAAVVEQESVKESAFEKERIQLEQRLVTLTDNSEEARVLFETTKGGLRDILPAEKEELIKLAQRVDLLRQSNELLQESAEVEDYLRGVALEREKDWQTTVAKQRDAAERTARTDATRALREQQRLAEQQAEVLAEPFKNALRGAQTAFADAFEAIFSGGVSTFGDLARQVKGVFIRLAAEIASLLVFRPVMGGILGALGMSGMSAQLGLSGTGSGLGGTPGLGGGLGGGFNIGSLLSGMQSEFGAGLGIGVADALGLGAWGQSAFAGAGLNAPWTLVGSGLNMLLGIDNGIGSTLGGLAGAGIGSTFTALGAAGGPIGAIAGTVIGGLLGGIFGGKPSRKASHATVGASDGSFGARFAPGGAGGDAVMDTAGRAAEILNRVLKDPGAIAGNFGIIEETNAAKTGSSPFYLTAVPAALRRGTAFASINARDRKVGYGSEDELLAAIEGIARNYQQKLDDKQAADEARDAAREQAQAFLASADASQQYVAQVDAVIRQFADLRGQARELGLSLADINRAEASQLRGMRGSTTSQIRGLVNQGRQILGIDALEAFQRELSFGDLAQVTPAQRFALARADFGRLAEAARTGDVDAIQQFPGAAQSLLQLGRTTYASGAEFQSLFRDVNATLNDVLARQRELERSLTADLTITMRETAQDQIAAINEQTRALGAALAKIERRLARVA